MAMNMRISVTLFFCSILFLPVIINGCNEDPTLNNPPFILTIEADSDTVHLNQTITLIAFADDPDEDTIYYRWKVMLNNEDVSKSALKTIIPANQRIQFVTNTPGKYWVEVTAEDNHKGKAKNALQIEVMTSEARNQQLAIIRPKYSEKVNMYSDIEGTYYEIPEDKWIAVYTCKHGTDKWLIQPDDVIVLIDGYWILHAKIGEQNDNGTLFDIGVKFMDRESIINKGEESHIFHDLITVTRG